jgi:integrase
MPKGYWEQPKRLASGGVVRYGYLGRGAGTTALGRVGSPEYFEALARAVSNAPKEGTVASLAHAYLTSKKFLGLAPRTQRDYRRFVDAIKEEFGALSIGAMQSKTIIPYIRKWHERLAKASPRQADYAVSVLSAMLAWCVKWGLIDHNRAAGIEDAYTDNRSEKVWTPEDVAKFMAKATAPLRLALTMAIETGLSQGDLLGIARSAVQGDLIVTKRRKTGVAAVVPISPELAAALAAAPKDKSVTILTKDDGLPWDPKANGFRAAFRATCVAAGVTGLTFNDLRGTFITRRREMGWTSEEMALCSGHPIAGEKGAQKNYVDRLAVATANAKRLHARWYESPDEAKAGTQTAN